MIDIPPSGRSRVPDLALVASIVRRAGVLCELEPGNGGATLRAWRAGRETPGVCTVSADPVDTVTGSGASAVVHEPHRPDERLVAALVIAQVLRRDPATPLSLDDADALGLACGTSWIRLGR